MFEIKLNGFIFTEFFYDEFFSFVLDLSDDGVYDRVVSMVHVLVLEANQLRVLNDFGDAFKETEHFGVLEFHEVFPPVHGLNLGEEADVEVFDQSGLVVIHQVFDAADAGLLLKLKHLDVGQVLQGGVLVGRFTEHAALLHRELVVHLDLAFVVHFAANAETQSKQSDFKQIFDHQVGVGDCAVVEIVLVYFIFSHYGIILLLLRPRVHSLLQVGNRYVHLSLLIKLRQTLILFFIRYVH